MSGFEAGENGTMKGGGSEPSWRRAEREEGEMWEYVRNEHYSDELFKA